MIWARDVDKSSVPKHDVDYVIQKCNALCTGS